MAEAGCLISGQLVDRNGGDPIAGAILGLVEFTEDVRNATVIDPNAGVTDAEGGFSIGCDAIASSRFPLRITLARSDWWGTTHTHTAVYEGGHVGLLLTFDVCQALRPLDVPLATDTLIDGGPTRLRTILPRGNAAAYDFNPRLISASPRFGDFYISYCGEPVFWANNNGPPYYQQGAVDLGDLGDIPLEDIVPSAEGYQHFGVPAVVGHTYVSRARQEFAGDHIVFRVVDVETDGVVVTTYVLEYYYRAGN